MGFFKAVELFFGGSIIALVLLTFLGAIVPVAQETIANAPANTFALSSASQLMLGLIGFVFVAGLIYAGVRELMNKDDGDSGRNQGNYGYGG